MKEKMVFLVRERPLLQGVPSFKTVHRTVLKFTLCGAPDVRGFRCLRTAMRALPSTRHLFLRERRTENGEAILSGVTVVTVTLGQKKPVIISFYNKAILLSVRRR